MKKFLSLVLALVMTMSLVTVSAGAKDFTDDSKINYEEAVAVMSDLKVLGGYTDGSFNPQGNLTRQAAAKIICNMILGPTTAAALRADTAPFKDVPATNEFAGYITYCAQQGIISGYADGEFKPGNPLTGYAFMKMLLGALGYDAQIEGYVGANWSVQVAKRAIGIGLNDGLIGAFNGVKTVNREEATLYAFNTLQATMVEYDSRTTVSVGGADVVIAGSSAKNVAQAGYKNTMGDATSLQFAEKYFTKLTKEHTTDVFGRPATEWVYNKDSVGAFVDYTTFVKEYTTEVTGAELYDLLGSSALKHSDVYVCIDGVDDAKVTGNALFTEGYISKNNKDGVGATGNGVLTQVFYDKDNNEITIAIINTYLAKATDDYNEKKDEVPFDVYGVTIDGDGNVVKADASDDIKVSGEDFAVEDVEEGDFFLFTMAAGDVQSMAAPEVVEETTISSFKKGTSVKAEGETYAYADSAWYDDKVLDEYDQSNMKETTYNLYLDANGYMIGVEKVAGESRYVFITGYEAFGGVLDTAKTDARAIFTDGTVETITVKDAGKNLNRNNQKWDADGRSQLNTWYTYTTDKSGNYSLTLVKTTGDADVKQGTHYTADKKIDKSHISLLMAETSKFVQGNDDSIYMTAKVKNVGKGNQITGVNSIATGVKNVDISMEQRDNSGVKGAYVLYDGAYIIAAVVVGKDNAATTNYAYTLTGDLEQEDYNADPDEWVWYLDVAINGEKVTLMERGAKCDYLDTLKRGDWAVVSYDKDGYVVDVDEVVNTDWVTTDVAGEEVYTVLNYNNFTNLVKEDVNLIKQPMGATGGYELSMDGQSLYVHSDRTYDTGVDIAADANAVVRTMKGGKYKFEYYTSVKSALRDLTSTKFDGMVYFVMDEGLATTVIIEDDTNVAGFTPDAPATGKVKSVNLQAADGWYTIADKNGNALSGAALKGMKWALYTYAPGQDDYKEVMSGTFDGTNAEAMPMITGGYYYMVVDGVRSNTVVK